MDEEEGSQLSMVIGMTNTSKLILQISCPDKKGIVSKVSSYLFDHNINILTMDQYVDPESSIFFMRVMADLSMCDEKIDDIDKKIDFLRSDLDASIELRVPHKVKNVAILGTKETFPIYELLMRNQLRELKCNISCVISNHNDLEDISSHFGIPYHMFQIDSDKSSQEKKIISLIDNLEIDTIVLARYMQILSKDFVDMYRGRIINIHHGFLPAFKGGNPYRQAWERGVKVIGATAHYVTEMLDEGPIIEQDVIHVDHKSSVSDMVAAGRDIERRVLLNAVKAHLEDRIIIHNNRTIVFRK